MTPEQTVARYFELLGEERYSDAVDLMTEQCVRRFREHEAPLWRPGPEPTIEAYLERHPKAPREVAEYHLELARGVPIPKLSDYFAGVESVGDLDELDDRELLARHLQASDHAARHRGVIDRLRDRYPEFDSQLLEVRASMSRTWSFHILGSVANDERAFVLFGHQEPEDRSVMRWEPRPYVAVVRKEGTEWRIAGDPSPYSGTGIALGPIPVQREDGETVRLDPYEVLE